MPQASDEQRALMQKWFGDAISDSGPMQFLLARGWTEKAGMWTKPVPAHNTSIYEAACIRFLRDEWDYDWEAPLYPEDLV